MTKLSELDAMLTFGADDILAATEDASGNSKSVAGSVLRAYMQDADVTAATDAATVSTLMKRDAAGRAKVVAPSVAADIALKSTVTADIATHDALATAHGVIAGSDAAGGALTGNVYWEKIGNIVFITWATLSHASGSSAATAAGLIPAAFRPATGHYDTVYVYAPGSLNILVSTAGTVTFYYYDYAGAARNATQVLAGSTHYRAA